MAHVSGIEEGLLDEHEAAAMLGMKVKTLRTWRCERRELAFIKLGTAANAPARYERSAILEYIAQHRRVPSVRASSRIAHDTY